MSADDRAPGQQGTGAVRRFTHPGFLDLQVNGFAGVDFNDPATTPDQVRHAAAVMRQHGVTRFLPTIISSSAATFETCARTVLRANDAAIAGIHLEGPYISPEDGARGAHRREDVAPASIDDFKRRQDAAGGRIRLVTVAPEVPGAIALIEHLRASGIRVAIGHTAASPEQIREAVRAGATLSTHLGNGCANMLPRHPNFIWEQLAADELAASLIVDGHHLPPATVKTMVRAKTPRRVVLVTDAIAAAGQPPGEYQLGALRVRLDETGRAAVPGQPNLAGSALSLDRAVGNVVKFAGISLEEALAMASTQPAAYLGVEPGGSLDLEWDPARFTLRVLKANG
ncbi:MAG TPA: amidohydrolase family protein [Vicinamibacterales bacterium]|nr:amidohydrolase family protein [Acidobacteriota bacterium]HOC18175.1 amidohydrolase family protein [Vicinamibacterales bacterium]